MKNASCSSPGDNGSFLHLWTINGKGIWKTSTKSQINCIDFSCAPEGISVNVVAAGLQNGIIRYYLRLTAHRVSEKLCDLVWMLWRSGTLHCSVFYSVAWERRQLRVRGLVLANQTCGC